MSSRGATTRTASGRGSASRIWASPRQRWWSAGRRGPSSSAGRLNHMEPLLDRLGRPLETLRISITDRCNFRCVYCMPKEVFGREYAFLERRELLTLEEMARVTSVFAGLGVQTVRITGGEPLVRRNVEVLVELLSAIRRPDGSPLELALTTNGSLLAPEAKTRPPGGGRRR